MVALGNADLPPQELRAGDVIEYFSTAFVCGDARGHRFSRVLRISKDDDEFPIRVDTGEMLPTWIMLRVRLNVDDTATTDSFWGKMRSLQLIDGVFDAPTRAQMFNKSLKSIIDSAFKAVAQESHEISATNTDSASPDPRAPTDIGKGHDAAGVEGIADCAEDCIEEDEMNYQDPEAREDDFSASLLGDGSSNRLIVEEEQGFLSQKASEAMNCIALYADVPLYAEKRARRKQLKSSRDPVGHKYSRAHRYQKLRTPVRDSKRAYFVKPMKAHSAKDFLRSPGFKESQARHHAAAKDISASAEVVDLTMEESPTRAVAVFTTTEDQHAVLARVASDQGAENNTTTEGAPIDVAESGESTQECALWPSDINKLSHNRNPDKIRFDDVGDFGFCYCPSTCDREMCANAVTGIYCNSKNCFRGADCANKLLQRDDLILFERAKGDFGVGASSRIEAGVIVAEYCGRLLVGEPGRPQSTSGYTLEFETKTQSGLSAYLEPVACGSIGRFMNHSCEAKCMFVELRYRRSARIAIVALREIEVGEEITIDYGSKLWFDCKCNKPTCRSRQRNASARKRGCPQ